MYTIAAQEIGCNRELIRYKTSNYDAICNVICFRYRFKASGGE